MHAGDDHIQFRQQVVGEIELAVVENVHFGAGEQAEIGALVREIAD